MLEYVFEVAAGHSIDEVAAVNLGESIRKEVGSRRYRLTCLNSMEHALEGHLRAEQHVGRIQHLQGPFTASILRSRMPLHEPLYITALERAVAELRDRENEAARVEGLEDLCSDLIAILPFHDGYTWELRLLFDYGQKGARAGKAARIWKIGDMGYELEWV